MAIFGFVYLQVSFCLAGFSGPIICLRTMPKPEPNMQHALKKGALYFYIFGAHVPSNPNFIWACFWMVLLFPRCFSEEVERDTVRKGGVSLGNKTI